ncbi:DUF1127 domain-containing protein [Nitratireductor sp. CAU 1489]|uniref:DUF1127 domain-containing protein n=2 Tax=Nitratireductor arenosus TaxID=2682096 RepID=A0A844QN59_9HYPH|nr:DUF1127 domain-containing protein [Nitratireductor arenosus]
MCATDRCRVESPRSFINYVDVRHNCNSFETCQGCTYLMGNSTHEVVAMALTFDFQTGNGWFARRMKTPGVPAAPKLDAPTRALLAKHDDRLLHDIGISRAELQGQDAVVFDDLARQRRLWQL